MTDKLKLINAVIIDGSNKPSFKGEVLIENSKIIQVAEKIQEENCSVLDLENRILTPGFIDPHTHSDISLVYNPHPRGMIIQGVTTQIIGNCGYSPYPLLEDEEFLKKRRQSLGFVDVSEQEWCWGNMAEFREKLFSSPPNANIAYLVGHGSIRAIVKGYSDTIATEKELEEMSQILSEHLKAGAIGISTGLGYAPDFYSDTNELIELGKVVKKYDKIFTFHVRGDRATLFKAINEALIVGEKSECRVHISHIKTSGIYNAGKSKEIIEMINNALNKGVKVSSDLYPYTAGSAYLGLVFPPYSHEGGFDGLKNRLNNEEEKELIFKYMKTGTPEGWSSLLAEKQGKNIVLSAAKENPKFVGKTLFDISELLEMSIEETAKYLYISENGDVDIVLHTMEQSDVDEFAKFEHSVFCSDGLAMDTENLKIREMPHPRNYGSFTKIIQEYVLQRKVITLEEAIYKMSGLTAKMFSIPNRGEIKVGNYADLVAFYPENVSSKATFEKPNQLSSGIDYVWLNGKLAVKSGEYSKSEGMEILI